MLHNCRSMPEPTDGCFSNSLRRVPVALNSPRKSSGDPDQTNRELFSLYRRFVLTAVFITLTFGTFWGVSILTKAATTRSFGAPDPAQIQAHAHAQVFGWIGLLIMGVAYYVLPKFKQVRVESIGLIAACYWLMTGGIFIRAICQPFAENPVAGVAVAVSGLAELVAAFIFASVVFSTISRSTEKFHIADVFMLTSVGWLLTALAINFYTMIQIARTSSPVIAELWNLRRMNVEVFGFIITMILGVGARILPRLLGLQPLRFGTGLIVAAVYTAGVALKAFSSAETAGSLLITGAATLYLAELNLFARFTSKTEDHLRRWTRVAFFWLAASGAMMLSGDAYAYLTGNPAPHAWIGAYRHAVTVGFITTLAVGVALRTVPLFHGVSLYSQKLVTATFWLLVTGNACRVIFQIFTLTQHPAAYAVAGMSGYLELTALILFGLNIYKTLSKPAVPKLREENSKLLFERVPVAA